MPTRWVESVWKSLEFITFIASNTESTILLVAYLPGYERWFYAAITWSTLLVCWCPCRNNLILIHCLRHHDGLRNVQNVALTYECIVLLGKA